MEVKGVSDKKAVSFEVDLEVELLLVVLPHQVAVQGRRVLQLPHPAPLLLLRLRVPARPRVPVAQVPL